MLQDPATWKALGRTDTWVALVAIIAIVGVVLLFKFILAFILDAAISTGGLPVAILIMLAGGGLYVWMKVVGRAPKKK